MGPSLALMSSQCYQTSFSSDSVVISSVVSLDKFDGEKVEVIRGSNNIVSHEVIRNYCM